MELDFLKGHMGGNRIILLDGRQTGESSERVLAAALGALDENRLCGHQAGVLFPGGGPGGLRVLIADVTGRNFIPACGGLTQVLGRALAETQWASRFGLVIEEPFTEVVLETEAGPTPITVHMQGGGFTHTESDLTGFAGILENETIGPLNLGDVKAFMSGRYLVLNADEAGKSCPGADFDVMNDPALNALAEIQQCFHRVAGTNSLHFSLYDVKRGSRPRIRALFPHSVLTGHVEPACGTGSIALGVALLFSGEGERLGLAKNGVLEVDLETGGRPVLGGPDVTRVRIESSGAGVTGAFFSHSFVEITAEGICQV
ncbi:MAG: hypothetical protein U9R40_04590 [Synergistota bacterium]|nr:hypothetical protein [Synergistota bacterium]